MRPAWPEILAVLSLLLVHSELRAGELAGTITPAARVKSVTLVDRTGSKTFAALLDQATGRFLVERLPAGTYDVKLTTDMGVIEGVNLRPDSSSVRQEQTFTPQGADRTDLGDMVSWLKAKHDAQGQKAIVLAAVVLKSNGGTISEVLLRPAKATEDKPTEVKLDLSADEIEGVGETLVNTTVFFEHRSAFAGQTDVILEMNGDKVEKVVLRPIAVQLSEADRDKLVEWVDNVKAFENKRRVLFVRGNDASAKVLVELIRDEPTTLAARESTVFWRVEVWSFRKLHGGWEKTDSDVIDREKLTERDFRKLNWIFDPRLGGFEVPEKGRATVPEYKVPGKLDAVSGRVEP